MSKENIIIFVLATPMVISAFFLMAMEDGLWASGATNTDEDFQTETIYSERVCRDCNCVDSGNKLLSFKGPETDCESYQEEDERTKCYFDNSHALFSCPELQSSGEVEDCFSHYNGPVFDYYQGGPGTLVTSKSISSEGSRMYLEGFDCEGKHIIKTGSEDPGSNAITIYEASRDIHFGGNVDVFGDLTLLSAEGGIYFGANVQYGLKDLGRNKIGQGIVSYDNLNGLNMNECLDARLIANHRHAMTIVGSEREDPWAAVELEDGLEINGDLKIDERIFWGGRRLKWSEPIRGHFILYYSGEPVLEQTECEEDDYERDTNIPDPPDECGDEEECGELEYGTDPGFDHYNPAAFDSMASAVVLCAGSPEYTGCSIGEVGLPPSGEDKCRQFFSLYGQPHLSGELVCSGPGGTQSFGSIDGSGSAIIFGHCEN